MLSVMYLLRHMLGGGKGRKDYMVSQMRRNQNEWKQPLSFSPSAIGLGGGGETTSLMWWGGGTRSQQGGGATWSQLSPDVCVKTGGTWVFSSAPSE